MTREEKIENKVIDHIKNCIELCNHYSINESDLENNFADDTEWVDTHPKSSWISVKDDLPCNHKELLLSTGCHTVNVFTYKKGGACSIDNMIVKNGKWEWEAWKENYLYWMPIPKLPK